MIRDLYPPPITVFNMAIWSIMAVGVGEGGRDSGDLFFQYNFVKAFNKTRFHTGDYIRILWD